MKNKFQNLIFFLENSRMKNESHAKKVKEKKTFCGKVMSDYLSRLFKFLLSDQKKEQL